MSVAVDARSYVHPQALCEAVVGAGTRVWAFAHVMSGAIVGTECNIGEHAFIESGARIGDRVTVKNGAMVFYGVTIADEVFVGPDVVFTNDRTPRSPRVRAGAPSLRSKVGGRTRSRTSLVSTSFANTICGSAPAL